MKRKIPFLHILFSAVLFWLSAWSFACNPAQGSGQCGYYDQYGRYQNTAIGSYVIPPPSGYSPSSSNTNPYAYIPPQRSRYGAVAYSFSDNRYATVKNMPDPIDAENEALKKCGVADCKLFFSYDNGCVSLLESRDMQDNAYLMAYSAATSEEAQKKVLARCAQNGYRRCRVIANECSLPY